MRIHNKWQQSRTEEWGDYKTTSLEFKIEIANLYLSIVTLSKIELSSSLKNIRTEYQIIYCAMLLCLQAICFAKTNSKKTKMFYGSNFKI